jgi:formate hydrogenlyase subunit 6/NADH:ubiquinone oxidoreductase subunit I
MFERYGKGIAKGLTVTFRHLFRHPITTQVPEQRLNISRRTRGNELIWDKDKCTGCGTCAKACHIGAIHISTSTNPVDNKY